MTPAARSGASPARHGISNAAETSRAGPRGRRVAPSRDADEVHAEIRRADALRAGHGDDREPGLLDQRTKIIDGRAGIVLLKEDHPAGVQEAPHRTEEFPMDAPAAIGGTQI